MSQTIIGLLITILGILASKLNLNVSHEELIQIVGTIATIYGLAHTFWGRYRQGDITIIGTKK